MANTISVSRFPNDLNYKRYSKRGEKGARSPFTLYRPIRFPPDHWNWLLTVRVSLLLQGDTQHRGNAAQFDKTTDTATLWAVIVYRHALASCICPRQFQKLLDCTESYVRFELEASFLTHYLTMLAVKLVNWSELQTSWQKDWYLKVTPKI